MPEHPRHVEQDWIDRPNALKRVDQNRKKCAQRDDRDFQGRTKTQKQNEGQLKKMEEYAKKCRAAAHKSKLGKIFSMVGKVLGFAVAVGLATVAAVASGGAASPALALALVAMVGAGVALSSEISDRAGGATFSIASGFQTLGKKIGGDGKLAGGLLGLPFGMFDPSLFGMVAQGSAEAAHASEQSTMIAGIVGSVAGMLLVGLVSGRFLSSASKVGDAAQAAQQVSKEAFKSYWPKLFNQAGMAMQGVGNAVEAGINLDVARAQTAADKVEAARKEGEADLSRLSHDWEDIQESLGVAIKTLQDGLKQYGEFLRADAQNNMTVTANIGRATV